MAVASSRLTLEVLLCHHATLPAGISCYAVTGAANMQSVASWKGQGVVVLRRDYRLRI